MAARNASGVKVNIIDIQAFMLVWIGSEDPETGILGHALIPKKKGKLLISHRSTAYPCYLPVLGGFSRSWSYETCPWLAKVVFLLFPAKYLFMERTCPLNRLYLFRLINILYE